METRNDIKQHDTNRSDNIVGIDANLVDGAWQALGASVSSALMAQSQEADGGNL